MLRLSKCLVLCLCVFTANAGATTVFVTPTGDDGATGQSWADAKGAAKTESKTILLPGGVPLEMVWIPAGTFQMGRYPGEQDSYPSEDPQHDVTFSSGFWMGKYLVTQAQWVAVMGSNPSAFSGDSRPVENVSWDNVQSFLSAVQSQTGKVVRLPSEAEWEYACRAGTTTRFYWGDDPTYVQIGDYAWHYGNSGGQTHDVAGRLPNPWDLYDMSGNVWEWCEDDWHDNYTNAPSNGNAWVDSPRGDRRLLRGGGWVERGDGFRCYRSGDRDWGPPSLGY